MYGRNRYADAGAAVGGALSIAPTHPVYGTGDAFKFSGGYWQNMQATDGFSDKDWTYTTDKNTPQNPLAALEQRNKKANSNDFVGNVEVDYKVHFLPDLRLHASIGGEYADGNEREIVSPYSYTNNYYGWNGLSTQYKYNISYNAYAQYIKSLGAHDFDIMVGGEEQHFHRNGADGVGQGWDSYKNEPVDQALRSQKAYATRNTLVSFFGRANYTLLDRYFLTATVRDDGSSRFKEHWAWFPSFAFAWKANEEAFLKNANWLSDLKLRLGYGKTGQQAGSIGDYEWIPSYSISTGTNGFYPVTGTGELYRPNNYRPDLKWETTSTYNVGLDWGILDQRLSGSVDWYYRKTTDLLNYAPLSSMAGYKNQAWQNIGSLKNTGVEAAITWRAIQTKDWFWTMTYNFTYNKNEITDLNGVSENGAPVVNTNIKVGDGSGAYLQANQVGYAMNSYYVYQQVYDKNGKPIENCVVDRNGDGKINESDKYLYKSPAAPVTMGFSSRLEYKNWDFGFSLRASIGNYVYNNVEQGMSNMNTGEWFSNSLKYFSNRLKSTVERNWQTYEITSKLSDYYVKNASFLKCDNITLGYSFNNLFKSSGWHGLSGRAYATASNVFTITNYDGLDPEVGDGNDNNLYPRPFSVVVGLSLNF